VGQGDEGATGEGGFLPTLLVERDIGEGDERAGAGLPEGSGGGVAVGDSVEGGFVELRFIKCEEAGISI
jgi:hypothetical protein